MGTVSFVAAYGLQPGTTSVGMGDPGSGRIGDLHVLVAALKNPSAGDPTANNGFQLVGVATVGTGADGAGVGQIRIGVFVREKDVAPSLGTTTLSNGSANVIQGSGAVFRRDNPGTFWRVTCLFGSDTVSDTTFSATVSDIFNAGAGDMVHLSNYFSAGVTPSTRGATFTGLTGTLTGIDSGSTANGNDLGVFTDRFAVTGGTLTAASVTTGSTAAATTGGVVHVLVEAVNAAGVAPPDTYLPDASLFNQVDDTGDPALGYLYQPWPEQVVDVAVNVQTLSAAGIDDADVVGQSTLSPGVATLSPTGIDGGAVGQATLTQTLAPAGFDTSAVGQASLVLSLAPAGIASAEVLGAPALTPGAVTVSPASIADGSAVGQTSLAQALAPRGIDGGAVGQTTLTQTLAPAGITGGNVGQSTLTLTLAPFGVDGSSTPGQTSLTVTVAVNPVSIPRTDAVGYTILTPGTVTISPAGIADASQVGQSSVTALGVPLNPASIPSGDRVGNTTLTPGTATISPAGIASGQAVGTSVLGRFLVPLGVPSLVAVGQAQLEITSIPPDLNPITLTVDELRGRATAYERTTATAEVPRARFTAYERTTATAEETP